MTEGGLALRLTEAIRKAVHDLYAVELDDIISTRPKKTSLGDAAFAVAFDLARSAKMAPRKIAEALASELGEIEGVQRIEVAGPGYLNFFLDRAAFIDGLIGGETAPKAPSTKVIVEHTNINPNKAAHIGHLRNAALGDTFVRVLRFLGEDVEVQNYIDDTGVQVADVVVGFLHIENMTQKDVERIEATGRFDYTCWDLYARVSGFYEEDRARLELRAATLKAIEEGNAPEAPLAAFIANAIVRCHLLTMDRIDVRYDLLPWESDILKLRFWDRAYQLLKDKGAIRLSTGGKNEGCWVMDVGNPSGKSPANATQPDTPDENNEPDENDEKVIVRSNGTVTYVGKDIAYQMWKLGLLDRQFGFVRFHDYTDPDGVVWSTTAGEPSADAPPFGRGERVYNVIDTRQAYLQDIVQRGVAHLASEQARDRSHHFSYEMVALTPQTCRELGFPVGPEDESKPYLEVSGRKGLGVKADDLLSSLEEKALAEVESRNPSLEPAESGDIANAIARGAVRYFMIKTTKNRVIAFDFAEALSFDGDSGPYLQYAAVRAAKILQKVDAPLEPPDRPDETQAVRRAFENVPEAEADDVWALIFAAAELSSVARAVVRTEEPAHVARFALGLAQRFNGFYHKYHIAGEEDPSKRALRLLAVQIFLREYRFALNLMGIPIPRQM